MTLISYLKEASGPRLNSHSLEEKKDFDISLMKD